MDSILYQKRLIKSAVQDQSLSDMQKYKTLNVATLANAFCRTILVNTDLNTWIVGSPRFKKQYFLELNLITFLLFWVTTSKPNGFGIMVLFYIIAYS